MKDSWENGENPNMISTTQRMYLNS